MPRNQPVGLQHVLVVEILTVVICWQFRWSEDRVDKPAEESAAAERRSAGIRQDQLDGFPWLLRHANWYSAQHSTVRLCYIIVRSKA